MEWPRVDGHQPYPWRIHWGYLYPYLIAANDSYVVDHNGAAAGYVRGEPDAKAMLSCGPHLCDVPYCPGPKLVAKLEAAEKGMKVLLHLIEAEEMQGPEPGGQWDTLCKLGRESLAAWDSARSEKEE